MPANSKSQRRLMAAAEHGASFPAAQQLRRTMTLGQLHDFAATPERGLPQHVKPNARTAHRSSGSSHPARNLGRYHHPKGS